MHPDTFNELTLKEAAARNELMLLAQLDSKAEAEAYAARNPAPICLKLMGALRRYEAATQAIQDEVAAVRKRRSDLAAELAHLASQPTPVPGSRAFDALQTRVRNLEDNVSTLERVVRDAESRDRSRPAIGPTPERASRAILFLARAVLEVAAPRARARIEGASDRYWIHALEPLQFLDEYSALIRTVRAAVGEDVPAPVIIWPAEQAWRRLCDRDPVTIGPAVS